MKITRSTLKSLIREEMNRLRTLNETTQQDAGLVYAQLSPSGAMLGVLRSAWGSGDYEVILQAGAEKDITPESAYDYFTTPGEGLSGLANTVVPMYDMTKRDEGAVAALDFAMKNGAEFNMPGWDAMNADLPFELEPMVLAKASEQ